MFYMHVRISLFLAFMHCLFFAGLLDDIDTGDLQIMREMVQKIAHDMHIQYRDLLHAAYTLKGFAASEPKHKTPTAIQLPGHYVSAGRIDSEANRGPSFGYHPQTRHSMYHHDKPQEGEDEKQAAVAVQGEESHGSGHYVNSGHIDSEANRGPDFGYHPPHQTLHPTESGQPS